MGYNTNITICNDRLSDYQRYPDRFMRVVEDGLFGGDTNNWGITVLPTDHADVTQLIAAGGNCATKVFTARCAKSHHTDGGQVELLRQWADAMGYKLVPNKSTVR